MSAFMISHINEINSTNLRTCKENIFSLLSKNKDINDQNILSLLQNGLNIDLNSSSYEEISKETWTLVDDLTDGIDTFLD